MVYSRVFGERSEMYFLVKLFETVFIFMTNGCDTKTEMGWLTTSTKFGVEIVKLILFALTFSRKIDWTLPRIVKLFVKSDKRLSEMLNFCCFNYLSEHNQRNQRNRYFLNLARTETRKQEQTIFCLTKMNIFYTFSFHQTLKMEMKTLKN